MALPFIGIFSLDVVGFRVCYYFLDILDRLQTIVVIYELEVAEIAAFAESFFGEVARPHLSLCMAAEILQV